MNDKEKKSLERFKAYLNRYFKGYCIFLEVTRFKYAGERRRSHLIVYITLHDATNFQLPALVLSEGNLSRMAECLEVNRNKIMMLHDQE